MRCAIRTAAGHRFLPGYGEPFRRLDELYGARIETTVRKKGENQCVGFVASLIDDSFAARRGKAAGAGSRAVGELICDPVTERGRFVPSYFESEKTNLLDAIRSLVNDKRDYADSRLLREMCAGDPMGFPAWAVRRALKACSPNNCTRCIRS